MDSFFWMPPSCVNFLSLALPLGTGKPGVSNLPPRTMCGILGIFGSGLSETDLRSKLIECSKM